MNTSKVFELLHMDLFGPTQYTSIGGNKYGLVIVDDYTRYTWVFFLVDKSDVFATFKSFIKGIQNEFVGAKTSTCNKPEGSAWDEPGDPLGFNHRTRHPCEFLPRACQSIGPTIDKERKFISNLR